MEELFKVKDEEIAKLLSENKSLSDELRQCQADKEFVWSLWKRLQVSSPDLTQAISLVLQREKEKSETKDQKVLEILQTKDQQIVDLQETVTSLKRDNDKLLEIKVYAEGDRNKQVNECQQLKSQILKMKLDQERLENNIEENKKDYKSSLDAAESECVHLNEQITNLITDLQEMRTNCQLKSDGLDDIKQLQTQLDNEKKDLQAVVKRLMAEKQILESDLDSVKLEFDQLRNGIDFTEHNLKTRDQDYQDLKESYNQLKLHNQHQKQVIAQLQELNNNNKRIVKEQTSTHKHETDSLQSMYDEILRKYEDLIEKHKKLKLQSEEQLTRIQAQNKALEVTKKELKKSIGMASGRGREYDYDEMDTLEEQVHKQRREIDNLRQKLREKVQNKRPRREDSPPEHDYDQTFSPIIERGATRNGQRCRSMSPGGQNKRVNVMQKKLKATETKLDDTKHLLELKRGEIKELQRAHNKRLERLRVLQSDYRSLKSNLMENEERTSPRKHRSKSRMSKPQNLRQENSESVWNDLAIYRQENKALSQDKMMLEEEVDHLRVQTAMDRATIQDLNLCLKAEKEELMARMRPVRDEDRLSSTPKKNKRNISPTREPKPTRRQTKNLERRLENAGEDNRILKKDRDRMLNDNKVLKNEIKSLKREITETRQTGTKIRQENSELRRKVETLKGSKEQFEREAAVLRQESQGLRTENSGVRSENSTLRTENSDLRQDVNDLKQELADLKCELQEIDQGMGDNNKRLNAKATSNAHRKPRAKTATARKHQKFLNQSINDMKEAFGGDFDAEGLASTAAEDTTATTGIIEEDRYGRSDVSSLGQSIVRASRQPLDGGYDIDKDEDDTLVDEEPLPARRGSSARRPSSLPRSGAGVLTTLKQRLASLQTQCNTLRNANANATKKANDEKERSNLIQSELTACQNRLKTSKQSIQRLNRESEVLSREKEDLQRALDESKSLQPLAQRYSDADYKYLENKLKSSNNDINRMTEQIKDMKKEIENKNDQSGNEKERISRLERDVSMKRQLIDELRVKVKDFESKTHTEHQNSVELEERIKQTEDDLAHKKNHVESLRRQLQVATKEKARYETMYNKSREELQKRSGQVSSLQASKLEAESVTSRLEEAAEKQLHSLASRSEQALDKLKTKLEKSEERSKEFCTFVQNLSNHMIDLLLRLRDSYYREKNQLFDEEESKHQTVPPSSSMSHAQNLACNILNMSQSDFQDLMAPVDVGRMRQTERDIWEGERSTSSKTDQQWKKKVEKIANENPPFAKSLCRLLCDKVQDAVKLGEDRLRLHTEHLEQQLLDKKRS